MTEQALNKYRTSTEQSLEMVRQLYEEKTDKMKTDSGKSTSQSVTLDRPPG